MSFGVLSAIVLAGLAGPLLGLSRRWFVPVMVGEIFAGILAGPAVLGIVHPADATTAFLRDTGFAMLMLTAGMHLPLRDRRLASSLREGALLAMIVAVLAIPAGLLAAAVAGTGHAAVYAVVLASGSAAVLLPALEEMDALGAHAMTVMAQVSIADVATILSVPVVLQPHRVGHAALGALLVAGAGAVVFAGARALEPRRWVHRLRALSKRRRWVLDLRLSLLVLFALSWLAERSGTSVLIAGFGAGLMVAWIGGPKRLSTQMRGVADGFFIPLYFVVLGAQLDLRGLLHSPSMLTLAAMLASLNVTVHVVAALALRRGPGSALAASAQLGVPAAVASLGLAEGVLSRTVATAIVVAALVSLAACTAGVQALSRRQALAAVQPGGA